MINSKIIGERQVYSRERLAELRTKIGSLEELKNCPNLCIYVTGSYARLEATRFSDLDLFLINKGSAGQTNSVTNIQEILLIGDVIRVARQLGFPDFSGDGRYIQVLYLDEIRNTLGGPTDDYKNYFTARLLLLLESTPIYNERVYREIVEDVIESYYRDYHDHDGDFRPIFLVNDILRYWRTLCLNYEHKRNRPAESPEKKNETHLKNLKLKFSRLLTCFSLVLFLSKNHNVITARELAECVYLPPLERMEKVAQPLENGHDLLGNITRDYEWFLERTGKPKVEAEQWISIRDERDDAFMKARKFRDNVFALLKQAVPDDVIRYLVM